MAKSCYDAFEEVDDRIDAAVLDEKFRIDEKNLLQSNIITK